MKEFVNQDGNQLNKSEDSLKKPFEPIYMIKCPKKILNDPTETNQEEMSLEDTMKTLNQNHILHSIVLKLKQKKLRSNEKV